MIPSRGLRRRLTDRGRDLNRRLTKSFRLPPASPQDSFSAVAGAGQPSEPERTSGASGVMESDRLFIPLQLPLSPVRGLARRIEHLLDVPIERSQHADA